MALALEKPLVPPAGSAVHQTQQEGDRPELDVSVVFTSVQATLRAIRQAAVLARSSGARITLIVPQIVPYPLPLASPPVLLDFNERRFFTIARESRVEASVRIYLCRDRQVTLMEVLPPNSTVVLGGRKRWWPTAEMRLAKRLRSMGHNVVMVEKE